MKQDTEKTYRKYQLQWMLDHGYDLSDIMHRIAEIIEDVLTYEGDAFALIDEAFDIMENECGFKGGMMWACYDEWLQNEYQQE